MPVCSYVVFPKPGQMRAVEAALRVMAGCGVRVSDDGRLLILVTDTADLEAEARLQAALQAVPGVAQMALSFGFTEPENLDEMAAKGLPEVKK